MEDVDKILATKRKQKRLKKNAVSLFYEKRTDKFQHISYYI